MMPTTHALACLGQPGTAVLDASLCLLLMFPRWSVLWQAGTQASAFADGNTPAGNISS